ncbi:MAG: 4Fe-4S dicluster domain-containing protein [Planctomycetota bacterium]
MAAIDRRGFLKTTLLVGLSSATDEATAAAQRSGDPQPGGRNEFGVLVDIPNCIGCRKCEYACQKEAGFPVPSIDSFDDKDVFVAHRRPSPDSFTTVNEFPNSKNPSRPTYVKSNCLHCNDPACASACLVGAFRKQPDGAVVYDASRCMGCRYCMVACPFQIPTYEYDRALTPQVRKCTFCQQRLAESGAVPACVRICPNDALIFGKRADLLELAHEKIRSRPGTYIDRVYGEHEAGGTAWLYLSGVPFERIGFPSVGTAALGSHTEPLQHGVFKFFVPPLALYGLLGLAMWLTRRSDELPDHAPASPRSAKREQVGAEPSVARPGRALVSAGAPVEEEVPR